MYILYLECNTGASGDMLMSALYELLERKDAFQNIMGKLLSPAELTVHTATARGIAGTQMELSVSSPQASQPLFVDPHSLLESPVLPAEVQAQAKAVYDRLTVALSSAGLPNPPEHVLPIIGVCLALHLLRPDRLVVSPIHLGSGLVSWPQGTVPIPTPVITGLLTGIPCYTGTIPGELCTPVGAALLAHFGQEFGPMPIMTTERIGCGIRDADFPVANCVRAFWGRPSESQPSSIVELCCHIDDMTAEALAFASERLITQGALDVSFAPLTMKKGRAGVTLTVLCRPSDEARVAEAILRQTSSNGVRARRCGKYLLAPSIRTVETSYGPIRIKCADGYGIHREKPEYEDVAAAARKAGLPFQKVWEAIVAEINRP